MALVDAEKVHKQFRQNLLLSILNWDFKKSLVLGINLCEQSGSVSCPKPLYWKTESSIILPTQQAYNIVKALVLSTKQTVVLCRLDLSIRITVYKTGHMQKKRIIVILFLQALTRPYSQLFICIQLFYKKCLLLCLRNHLK